MARDHLHKMCVALLKQQRIFLIDKRVKDCDQEVKIVFHYTNNENMNNIRTYGLMSKNDRRINGVVSNFNGKNVYYSHLINLNVYILTYR